MVAKVFQGIYLDGGFRYFLSSSLFGEDEPILTNNFQMGWNHQPVNTDVYRRCRRFWIHLVFFESKHEPFEPDSFRQRVCANISDFLGGLILPI